MPRPAPPTAPSNSASKANNPIFMPLDPKLGRPGVGSPQDPARFNARGAKSGCRSRLLARFSGDQFGDVLFHNLLDQIEGVDDFANPGDLAAVERQEDGDIELH